MVRGRWLIGLLVVVAGCDRRSTPPSPGSTADASSTVAAAPKAALHHDADQDAGAALGDRAHNVLLLTIDSLRADMPWAGYDRPIAPNLTALRARSVAYDNAYATSSFTSKSVPGMLTGRYPSELVRTGSFFTKYVSADQFVCTYLHADGIPCIGGHAHMYFGRGQSGFDTGFDSWKLVPGITFDYQTDPYVTSDKLTPLAIEMLKEAAKKEDKPFFAWFHYMDPHDEYQAHEESAHLRKAGGKGQARARDRYDEEVFFTDLWIGKLLSFVESQPWAKNTVIIVTADHGEAFGEHGITRHAHELWEELVHVPFFIFAPGVAPRTISESRGHADLAPTIVELLRAKSVPPLPGTSLVPELLGTPAAPRDVIVDLPEDDYNERRRALIHGRTKIIAFGNDVRFALYDLDADPREADDLIVKKPELAREMRERYKDASKKIRDVAPRGGIPRKDPK